MTVSDVVIAKWAIADYHQMIASGILNEHHVQISDSALTKDLTVKQQIDAQAGILEYWVLEIQSQKVTIFRDPASKGYNNKQEFEEENITSLAFPDVEISLESIFSGEILN